MLRNDVEPPGFPACRVGRILGAALLLLRAHGASAQLEGQAALTERRRPEAVQQLLAYSDARSAFERGEATLRGVQWAIVRSHLPGLALMSAALAAALRTPGEARRGGELAAVVLRGAGPAAGNCVGLDFDRLRFVGVRAGAAAVAVPLLLALAADALELPGELADARKDHKAFECVLLEWLDACGRVNAAAMPREEPSPPLAMTSPFFPVLVELRRPPPGPTASLFRNVDACTRAACQRWMGRSGPHAAGACPRAALPNLRSLGGCSGLRRIPRAGGGVCLHLVFHGRSGPGDRPGGRGGTRRGERRS